MPGRPACESPDSRRQIATGPWRGASRRKFVRTRLLQENDGVRQSLPHGCSCSRDAEVRNRRRRRNEGEDPALQGSPIREGGVHEITPCKTLRRRSQLHTLGRSRASGLGLKRVEAQPKRRTLGDDCSCNRCRHPRSGHRGNGTLYPPTDEEVTICAGSSGCNPGDRAGLALEGEAAAAGAPVEVFSEDDRQDRAKVDEDATCAERDVERHAWGPRGE